MPVAYCKEASLSSECQSSPPSGARAALAGVFRLRRILRMQSFPSLDEQLAWSLAYGEALEV